MRQLNNGNSVLSHRCHRRERTDISNTGFNIFFQSNNDMFWEFIKCWLRKIFWSFFAYIPSICSTYRLVMMQQFRNGFSETISRSRYKILAWSEQHGCLCYMKNDMHRIKQELSIVSVQPVYSAGSDDIKYAKHCYRGCK